MYKSKYALQWPRGRSLASAIEASRVSQHTDRQRHHGLRLHDSGLGARPESQEDPGSRSVQEPDGERHSRQHQRRQCQEYVSRRSCTGIISFYTLQ